MKIIVPISPGEFFDKLTILVNKVYHCKNNDDLIWAIIGLIELAGSYKGARKEDWNRIADSLMSIRNANKELWHLEEQVRAIPSTQFGDKLIVSEEIRTKNAERWKAKRSINDQLGATREVKDYASTTVK